MNNRLGSARKIVEEEEDEEIREKYTVNRGGDSGRVCARAIFLSSPSASGLPRARHPSSCSPTSLEYVDGVDSVYARLRVRTARVLCLANERAFCPSSPFSNSPPSFPRVRSPSFFCSRTIENGREKEKGRERESSTHLCPPYRGSRLCSAATHSLTHSPALSCHVAPDREHCRHLSRSTIPPTILLFFLFLHRASSSPRFSVLLSVFPSSSPWCVAQ